MPHTMLQRVCEFLRHTRAVLTPEQARLYYGSRAARAVARGVCMTGPRNAVLRDGVMELYVRRAEWRRLGTVAGVVTLDIGAVRIWPPHRGVGVFTRLVHDLLQAAEADAIYIENVDRPKHVTRLLDAGWIVDGPDDTGVPSLWRWTTGFLAGGLAPSRERARAPHVIRARHQSALAQPTQALQARADVA